ncbi:MAG: hypothetical protein LBP98_06630 [Tannerella sp.]|nr:hypothetical protein [Tannerella sp.]
MTACVSEEGTIDPRPPVIIDEEDEPGKVTLQIVFPKMNRGFVSTKAISSDEENVIDSLDVFVFKNASISPAPPYSINDQYLYRVSVPKDSIKKLSASNDTTYRVRLTLKTMPAGGQRLICVANLPKNLSLSLDSVGGPNPPTTVEQLVDQLIFSGAPWRDATPVSAAYPRLPMWGQMKDTLTFKPGEPLPTIPVITMIRSVAKIEVGVDVYGTGDPAIGFGHIFTLDSVYVCNANENGYIAPLKGDIIAGNTVASKVNPYGGRTTVVAGYKFAISPYDPPDSRKMSNTIYVPETDTLNSSKTDPAFLVIKAKYYDYLASDSSYYYRIDFTDAGQYKPLLRNHNYLVNILNIRMPGYRTLKEAMEAPLTTNNYAVVIEGDPNTVSSEIMDISVYNNEYMLGVNTSEVMFDWMKDAWLGKESAVPGATPLLLYTDCGTGWKATVPAGSWVTLGPSATPSTSVSGGKTTSAYNLEINATANFTGVERTDTITLTAGMLTKKIKVRQSGGANSFFLDYSSSNNIFIPWKFANTARSALGLSPILTTPTAPLKWAENLTLATSVSGDQIIVDIHTVTKDWGNALIALVQGVDTLWSFHIWVVKNGDDINNGYHSLNTKSVFMDRLLGGSMGGSYANPGQPYYQWGRKDPFLPGRYVATTGGSVASAVGHPGTFYKGSAPYYNWEGSNNSNLWNGSDGKKAYSDPCPAGWRVPYYQPGLITPWQNETNPGKYRNTGYISPEGIPDGPGAANTAAKGYIWTGYASWNGYYAGIDTGGSLESSPLSSGRGYGYAIRCVKDISRKY